MEKNTGQISNYPQGQENEIDFIGGADLDGDEDFEFTDTGGHNQEDDEFDELVGALQDIVLDPEFEEQQREFLEKNCMIFEDEEENKIEYMGIFKEYQAKLENFIENRLMEIKPDLNMKKFYNLLETRIEEVDPQLLDMLLTFSDFQMFKEHMLAHKKLQLSIKKKSKKFEEFKQDKGNELTSLEQDLSALVISGQSSTVHAEKGKWKESQKGNLDLEIKPAKTTEKVNKENKGKEKEKEKAKTTELKGDDVGKFTHKKTSGKADADFKPKSKNIFH